MKNKNIIRLNTIDLGGGTAKGCNCEAPDLSAYAKKEDVPTKVSQLENDSGFVAEITPEFLYLPNIGITTDIISALSTPINVTAEQAQAIIDAKYVKFAPRTMYNELSHYTVTTTESPIFKVITKESWLGHGYYSISIS